MTTTIENRANRKTNTETIHTTTVAYVCQQKKKQRNSNNKESILLPSTAWLAWVATQGSETLTLKLPTGRGSFDDDRYARVVFFGNMTSLAVQAAENGGEGVDGAKATDSSVGDSPTTDSKVSRKATLSHLHSLYDDAKARKLKRTESKKKHDLQTGCTFQPKLHKSSSRFNMKTMKNNNPAENRFDRLYQQATDSQKKKKEKIAATPYNCTFQPKLSKKSSTYKSKIGGSVGDRLHYQATQTQKKKKEMEKVEGLRGCTFQPKLSKRTKESSRGNLYDLGRMKQKKILLEQKRMESEIRGCTFSPALAPKTERLVGNSADRTKSTTDAVYNRLHSSAKRREEKIEEMRRTRVDNSMVECSFTPKILQRSKSKKNASDSKSDKKAEVGNRLYQQGQRSIEKKKKLVEDDKIRLKNLSKARRMKKGGYNKADQDKLFNRLYEQGKKKTQKRKNSPGYKSLANAKMEAMALRECTFKPAKISNISDASLDSDRYSPPLSKPGAKRSLKMDAVDEASEENSDRTVVRKVVRPTKSPETANSFENGTETEIAKNEEDHGDNFDGEGLGDSAIDMLGNKIDKVNSLLAISSIDTGNEEKQMKKVESRKSFAV